MGKNVIIMGLGAVGEAVHNMLLGRGHEVTVHDPPKSLHAGWNMTAATDAVFICVPAPTKVDLATALGGEIVDLNIIRECLSVLSGQSYTGIVILRSTALPGSTDKLQDEFRDMRLYYMPEFLTEATRFEDAKSPTRTVIGVPEVADNLHVVRDVPFIHSMLPTDNPAASMMAREAELLKYVTNSFYALKVAYFNQIKDVCDALDMEYEGVRYVLGMDPWVGTQHTDVDHGGYRGFGGKCLPKDVEAFTAFARTRANKSLTLVEEAIRYNNALRARER